MAGWGGNDAALGAEIPQWAIRRAEELCGCNFYGDAGGVAGAFARYIAQHEQPPVDPAIAWARELIADAVAYGAGFVADPERKRAAEFRAGDCDDGDLIRRAVEGYRKHKEPGK